jgi:tetratricopeptide (TPR) repeat protein
LGNAVNLCTAVVRKACLEEVGLFDEQLTWLEDYELWLRFTRRYELAYVPLPLAVYCRHGTNLSADPLSMNLAELSVVQRELKADPSLWQAAGKERVCWKLFYLCSEIAQAYVEAGDLPASRQYFEQALEYRPHSLAAWRECFGIGYAYFESGHFGAAHHYFGRALRRRIASPYLWGLWLATLLPGSVVGRLRRLKQRRKGPGSAASPNPARR